MTWHLFLAKEMYGHKMFLVLEYNSLGDAVTRLIQEGYLHSDYINSPSFQQMKALFEASVDFSRIISGTIHEGSDEISSPWIITDDEAFYDVSEVIKEKEIGLVEMK